MVIKFEDMKHVNQYMVLLVVIVCISWSLLPQIWQCWETKGDTVVVCYLAAKGGQRVVP